MIYDVDIVAVPEHTVVSLRETGPLSDMERRLRRLRDLAAHVALQPAGPPTARFYGRSRRSDVEGQYVDYDVTLPVLPRADDSIPDTIEEARGEWVPLHHVLQAVHRGPHDSVDDAWAAVHEAASAVGYTPSGPVTEVYERGQADGVPPADYVTLVRLPYAR